MATESPRLGVAEAPPFGKGGLGLQRLAAAYLPADFFKGLVEFSDVAAVYQGVVGLDGYGHE